MAPAPGTPLGGERPRQRASSPRSPRQGGGMAVDGGGSHPDRVFCPVPSCPCSDPARARGWRSVHNMHSHIDAHLAGTLSGDVPAEWMRQEGRQRCPVCSLSVSTRFGVHPTCRPEARAAAGPIPTTGRVDGLPTFPNIQAGHTPTLRHVPQAARHSWSKALTRALATAAHFNTEASWRELLMLPQTVLAAPPWGGKKHKKALAAYTLDRLERWHEGERGSLWASRPVPPQRVRRPRTPSQRKDLALSLAREGWDGKACAALLSTGLCPDTPDTCQALQALHPTQPAPDTNELHNLPPAPEVTPDHVVRALRSFPAGTSPGPSGLRAQHLLEAAPASTASSNSLGS